VLLIPIGLLAQPGVILLRTGLDVLDGNVPASAAALRPPGSLLAAAYFLKA
jgi:hypothetical protein